MNRRFTSAGNRFGAWMYRRLSGRFMGGGGRDPKVLLLTVPGRRTGQPRSTCVRFLPRDDGYVVWGTASGATADPDWFRNLRAAGRATVQVGASVQETDARELTGPERDEVWEHLVLERVPGVRRYARKAGRTIPVAVLTPGQAGVSP